MADEFTPVSIICEASKLAKAQAEAVVFFQSADFNENEPIAENMLTDGASPTGEEPFTHYVCETPVPKAQVKAILRYAQRLNDGEGSTGVLSHQPIEVALRKAGLRCRSIEKKKRAAAKERRDKRAAVKKAEQIAARSLMRRRIQARDERLEKKSI